MKTQKIVNLLNGSDNEYAKCVTEKCYVIDSESKGNYSHHDEIKFLAKSVASSLWDCSGAYILVTRNIAVPAGSPAGTKPEGKQPLTAATKVVFKNCVPFEKCSTEIDGTLVDEANFINIKMPMYNLIEYSDNSSDTSGSLWDFKRNEIVDNAEVANDDNTPSFKYKANLIDNTETDGTKKGVKIAVPRKYLGSFCKVELSLRWIEIVC